MQTRAIGPGDAIAIPPGATHQIRNAGPVVLKFLLLLRPRLRGRGHGTGKGASERTSPPISKMPRVGGQKKTGRESFLGNYLPKRMLEFRLNAFQRPLSTTFSALVCRGGKNRPKTAYSHTPFRLPDRRKHLCRVEPCRLRGEDFVEASCVIGREEAGQTGRLVWLLGVGQPLGVGAFSKVLSPR